MNDSMSPQLKVQRRPDGDAFCSIDSELSMPSVSAAANCSCSSRVSSPVPQPRSTMRMLRARLDQRGEIAERLRALVLEALVLWI